MARTSKKPTISKMTQKQINAMGDSVWMIRKLINEENHSNEIHEMVNRNVVHLEIMLSQPDIQNSGVDLIPFNDAINEGKSFISV